MGDFILSRQNAAALVHIVQHLSSALAQAGIRGTEALGIQAGKLTAGFGMLVQRADIVHLTQLHIRRHKPRIKIPVGRGKIAFIFAGAAVKGAEHLVESCAEILTGGGNSLAAAHLAQHIEKEAGRVDHQLFLQRGQNAAFQRALLRTGIIQLLGVDHGAVAVESAPQQIVGRHVVIAADLYHKREARLADTVFIMAQQRLADAQLRGGLALRNPFFLPQQAQCAGKISCHISHPNSFFFIQEVNYTTFYT